MIKALLKYKNYLFVITFVLYALGFSYNIFYYNNIGVNIFTYLPPLELFVKAINNCVTIILFIALLEIVVFIIVVMLDLIFHKGELNLKKYLDYSMIVEFIGSLLLGIVFKIFFFLSFLLIVIISCKLYFKFKIEEPDNKGADRYGYIIINLMIIGAIISFAVFGYRDSKAIMNGEIDTSYFIKTNDTLYVTGGKEELFFAGESQSAVFLYDSRHNNTIIVHRQNINEIVIVNKAMNEANTRKIQKDFGLDRLFPQ